jgi:molybdopterin-containing oxidoreductase family iron-sulfur binding subunit
LEAWPEAKWCVHEPIDRSAAQQAAKAAFGETLDVVYDFSKANIVVSLDADFLNFGPGSLRYARDFMDRRRVRTSADDAGRAEMNRLYAAETAISCTGAKADHRLALASRELEELARALAARLGAIQSDEEYKGGDATQAWLAAAVADLKAHRGRSLVVAGERQPTSVHLLAHAINSSLGNIGETIRFIGPIAARREKQQQSLVELADDAQGAKIKLLVILDANPVMTAPAELDFAERLKHIPLRIHFGLHQDETAEHCHWHLPAAHYLESWSDARAFDGTATIVQPLIEPLYQGRSVHEVASLFAGGASTPARETVRDTWRRHWKENAAKSESDDKDQSASADDFESFWQMAVHDGVVAGTAAREKKVSLADDWQEHLRPRTEPRRNGTEQAKGGPASADDELELLFLPDPTIFDGRYANNGWLQELPKPLTKLAWGNAAIMSPRTASRLDLEMGGYAHGGEHGGYHQPVIELRLGERTIYAPLWIMPGHVDGTVALYLGHGRRRAGRIGGDGTIAVGCDAYALRTADWPWFARGLKIAKTDAKRLVACVQQHHSLEDRDAVRVSTLGQYQEDPRGAAAPSERLIEEVRLPAHEPLDLYQPYDYQAPKNKWGMSIDLTACIGCEACMVACQAENNIPVVGPEQVAAGREMHWLRVDRYVHGAADAPDGFYFQPVPCMHCENAPCEYVCPVAATVHSSEGLNEMIYNRCVGTRFCSNNCPYKVRRFNFLAFADFETPTTRMQYNPDVTVRSRGVMEKCSYCVQRIRQGEIGAQLEDRRIVDGEVLTACQAVCPTRAISFGDMNDKRAEVTRWKDSPLHYALLEDLNTKPRTTYLAALRNPHPDLEEDAQ